MVARRRDRAGPGPGERAKEMNSFEHARFMGGAPRCIAVCKDQSSIRHFVVCLCVDLGGCAHASSSI
jgi:hypothetical protein